MADTDVLRNYNVGDPPTLPNGDKLYLAAQLRLIAVALNLIIQVVKKLEARMVAHGI